MDPTPALALDGVRAGGSLESRFDELVGAGAVTRKVPSWLAS